MKHESIVVVYDSSLHWQSDQRSSGQAIAEEIADKLGAETVSVLSMNVIKPLPLCSTSLS